MSEDFDIIEPKKRNPFYGLIALFLASALFLLSMQGYFYLIHPEPSDIPGLEEIQSFLPGGQDISTSYSAEEVGRVIAETQDPIKSVANFIVANACKKADRVCQSRALFYFVRDDITYVADSQFHDTLANPLSTLRSGGADCEDIAVLLVALNRAIGNEARLVFIPGHAFAQIRIPDYKGDNWLNLEGTCKYCRFNELPEGSALAKKTFVEL